MPPRWSRKPDRKDPDYRKLDDRMTFAVHVAAFGCFNSGAWFARIIQKADWPWTIWFTGITLAILVAHGLYIFAIADYSDPTSSRQG